MQVAKAHEIAAQWHDKQARGSQEIAADEPRLALDIRQRAAAAAIHHRAIAAGLRLAAIGIHQEELARR